MLEPPDAAAAERLPRAGGAAADWNEAAGWFAFDGCEWNCGCCPCELELLGARDSEIDFGENEPRDPAWAAAAAAVGRKELGSGVYCSSNRQT